MSAAELFVEIFEHRRRPHAEGAGARELRDVLSVHSKWLSEEVPGFAEALAWPVRGD